jgi:Winged helix DNA-binding domain
MTAPTLSARQLNRALLARQLLLKRARLPIPAALDQLAGIQNQYAPNAYIRLWSCLAGFGRDDLTKAYESSAVVQGTLMRGTIHTVSAADYHPLVAAIREPRQAWSRRIHKDNDADRAEVLACVRKGLERPLNRAQYLELLKGASRAVQQTIDTDAEILRVPPSGTWARRRAHIYGLADNYIEHRSIDAEAGRAHLVRRYLAGFGPSTPDEIATFCGIPLTTLRPTIEAMDLRPFQDEAGAKMVDIADGELPSVDTPAPVRFLPTWDAVLLVHARRTGVLPEEYRPLIFPSKVPPSFPTFLVDGSVAGTWHWDPEADKVAIQPFKRLPKRVMDELHEESLGLAELHR